MLRFIDDTKFSDLSKYEFVKDIGQGAFSHSCLMKEINTNNFYLFRIIHYIRRDVKPFLELIEFTRHINIPNFNKIYYYNLLNNCDGISSILDNHIQHNNNNIYDMGILVISEYIQNNDLESLNKDYLQGKKTVLTPTIRNKIIFGVACAMKYLHKNRIYYRDLKPKHILLNDKLEPVLTFCPLNQILPEGKKINSIAGTPLFMAPEVHFNRDKIGLPADVYSYSIFLYCLFSLNLKFDDNKELNYARFMHEIVKGHRFIRPKNIPDVFWDLIQACWKQNPEDRPTFDQITSELRDDKYALDEFGVKTDLNELHEYQDRVDVFQPNQVNFGYLMDKLK